MGGRPEKPGASGAAQPLPDIRLVEHRRHSCYELVASLTIILSADSFIFRAMTPMIRPFRQQDADKLAALWHEKPGHGFSGSFFVQRATAPFQIVGIISLRIAESWRPHSRSMFRTEGCYPSSGRPRIQCGRRAFVRHRLMRQVRLLSLVRQACDAPRFAPQECATQLG